MTIKTALRVVFPTLKSLISRIPVLLLVAWGVLCLLGGSSSTLGIFAVSVAPWVFLVALAWAAVSGLLRDWISLAASAMVGVLIAVAVPVFPVQNALPNLPKSQKQHVMRTLKVVEVNALLGGASPWAITRLVRNKQADVLVIAESTESFLTPGLLRAGLDKVLPYRYTTDAPSPQLGNAVWSRIPISNQRRVPGTVNPSLAIDVSVGGFPVTVVTTRVQNPLISRSEWASDMAALARFVSTVPKSRRLVLAGDFNSTFGHAPFQRILGTGLQDAQAKVSWPWQRATFPTFTAPYKPAEFPFLQIDHILYGRGFWVNAAGTVLVPRTDHGATFAELWLTRR